MMKALISLSLALFLPFSSFAAGTFRFLTQELPVATTDANFNYRVVTANAAGSVTFSIVANPDSLPGGMSLDGETGYVTGIPDSAGNYNFIIRATDGTDTINLNTLLKVSAAGGGGSPGVHFEITSLADGTVGTAYTDTLTVAGGTGPFTYMTSGVPGGLSTNGQTGVISGTPNEAGTFMVTVTALDQNDDTKSTKILPLKVLPADNNFQFTTNTISHSIIYF